MGQSPSCLSLYYVYYNIDIYNLSLLLLAYPFLSSTLFYFLLCSMHIEIFRYP